MVIPDAPERVSESPAAWTAAKRVLNFPDLSAIATKSVPDFGGSSNESMT